MKRQERCAGERTKFSADGERGGNLRRRSAVGANGRSERGRPQPNRAGHGMGTAPASVGTQLKTESGPEKEEQPST